MPKVTVLMPVYNGEAHLREAIDSILGQTLADFEFLIINDGSTDASESVVRSYSDPRIRLVSNDRNLGLIATLNKGLDLARGEFVARMDCDDISLPRRLETQVSFMRTNSDVGICGTWFRTTGARVERSVHPATSSGEVKSALLFNSPIGHPTVMMRRELIQKCELYYDQDFVHAEDYELWARAARVTHLANVPKQLLRYREHDGQISAVHNKKQQEVADRIRVSQLVELVPAVTADQARLHCEIARFETNDFDRWHREAESWLVNLVDANRSSSLYPKAAFERVVAQQWYRLCVQASGYGSSGLAIYWKSPLRSIKHIGIGRGARLLMKASLQGLAELGASRT